MAFQISELTFKKAFTHEAYLDFVDKLVADGKTTGENQSEAMVNYTALNYKRMSRAAKTYEPSDALKLKLEGLKRPLLWVVLTESWCGDAAINVPVLDKIASLSPMIELRLILRDEHLEIMDQFLTNGGRSIPKLICLDAETKEVLWDWGPRPKKMQDMVMNNKALPEDERIPYSELVKQVQLVYAKDRGKTLEAEVIALMS